VKLVPEAGLPHQAIPFPVEPIYRIAPDLRKLGPGEPHFQLDREWPCYLREKLALLVGDAANCRVMAGKQGIEQALWAVAELLASEIPEQVRIDDDGLSLTQLGLRLDRTARRSLSSLDPSSSPLDSQTLQGVRLHLESLSPVERLADALALSVQEDLVLMAGPPGADQASMFHVCFPSHWSPGDQRAASFARLHAPVPHNGRLLAGSRNLISAMLSKGPFQRYVWSLTPTPDLDQNPRRSRKPPEPGEDAIGDLWFRSERQTTRALGGDIALFTIRVYVAPLREVLDPGRARLLAAAIRSMDGALLSYKGLEGRRDDLISALDGLARN
jgi:hypothetical protein